MRIIARMADIRQASFLIDSLRTGGFDRSDLIVSDLAEDQEWRTFAEAFDEQSLIKTEREGLNELGTFADGIEDLQGKEGIIVAVKTPKHEADRVRAMMKQSGAVEIIQD